MSHSFNEELLTSAGRIVNEIGLTAIYREPLLMLRVIASNYQVEMAEAPRSFSSCQITFQASTAAVFWSNL